MVDVKTVLFGLVLVYSEIHGGDADTVCPDGWMADEGSCYLLGHQPVHFTQAESFCRHHNAHLVQVANQHQNDFLKDRMRDFKPRHWWIGMTDEATEGEWRLFNGGRLVPFTDWHSGQPEPTKDEDCAIFASSYDFQWADVSCIGTAAPVCEKQGNACRVLLFHIPEKRMKDGEIMRDRHTDRRQPGRQRKTSVEPDTLCSRGWIAYRGSCYLFAHYPVEYNEAKSYCSQHGGRLVEVHNSDVNSFIKTHLTELKTQHYWLGVSDAATEGVWEWDTSKTVANFSDWYPGQPSAGKGEDCGYFAYNYAFRWADTSCASPNVVPLCERRSITCIPETEIIG